MVKYHITNITFIFCLTRFLLDYSITDFKYESSKINQYTRYNIRTGSTNLHDEFEKEERKHNNTDKKNETMGPKITLPVPSEIEITSATR